MGDGRLKILYIASASRSGSTLLGNILGEVKGFFHAGELCYVWDRGILADWGCGCGVQFSQCPVWKAVLEKAFGGSQCADAQDMIARRQSAARTRYLPRMLMPRGHLFVESRLGPYLGKLAKLYRAIAEVTQSEVIVDSSKTPMDAHILNMLPGFDVFVLHLVRDSRAVAYSHRRRRLFPGSPLLYMPTTSAVTASLYWDIWNAAISMLQRTDPKRYMRLYYEDFVNKPVETVTNVLHTLGYNTSVPPFVRDGEIEVAPNHTFSGNPNRLHTGLIKVVLDNEWKTRMTPGDRFIVTLLTWPLLLRYGYPIRERNTHSGGPPCELHP